MYLNLYIIKEQLKDICEWSYIDQEVTKYPLCYPVMYSGEKKISHNFLYVTDMRDFPIDIELTNSVSFLCIGQSKEILKTLKCNVLGISNKISLHELFSLVNSIFFKFTQWENQLKDVLIHKKPIRMFGKLSVPYFNNPISLISVKFYNFFTVGKEYYTKEEILEKDNEPYTIENVELLKNYKNFIKAATRKGPQIWISEKGEVARVFYENIFFDSIIFSARLLVEETSTPMNECHLSLLHFMTQFVKISMTQDNNCLLNGTVKFEQHIRKLIKQESVEMAEIQCALSDLGWNINDTYFCIVIQALPQDIQANTLAALAYRFSSFLSGTCGSVLEDKIILIVNRSVDSMTDEKLYRNMIPQLRDCLMKAGISDEFHDFSKLYHYYFQCQEALRLGEKIESDFWYHRFSKFRFPFIADKALEFTAPESFCPPGLLRLVEHDREKGTEYVRMLDLYLSHNMIGKEVQNIMQMHRNTFTYRMTKINNLLQMDLHDSEVRFSLQLGIKILDFAKKK